MYTVHQTCLSSYHDEGKHNSSEVFNCVEDEQLPNCRAHGKEQKVQMNLRVLHDKGQCRIDFFGVNQRDKGQDSGKCRRHKHEFHHGQVAVSLEHTTLELTGKTVKEQKEK